MRNALKKQQQYCPILSLPVFKNVFPCLPAMRPEDFRNCPQMTVSCRAPEGIGYRYNPTSGFDQSASSSPSSSPCPAPNPVNAAAVASPKFSKPNTHEAHDQQRRTHSISRSFWLNAHFLPPSSLPPTSDLGGGFCCSRVQTAASSCMRAIESIASLTLLGLVWFSHFRHRLSCYNWSRPRP